MSKQSEAKLKQNYDPKPVPRVCGNCEYYRSTITEIKGVYGDIYKDESGKRCGKGGFSVKKLGTCDLFAGLYEANK